MSEDHDEALLEADRRTRILSLFIALAAYVAVSLALGDQLLGLLAAAFVGIGARIHLQYHVSKKNTAGEGSSLDSHPIAGGYHYGAVGAALVLGPLAGVVVGFTEPSRLVVIAAGVAGGVVSFAVLRMVLPK